VTVDYVDGQYFHRDGSTCFLHQVSRDDANPMTKHCTGCGARLLGSDPDQCELCDLHKAAYWR
jgi:hypothetical protein